MTDIPTAGSAEEAFRKGLACLEARSPREAASLFQEAIDVEHQEGGPNPRMKYLSYLGLAMTLAHGRSEDAIRLCEQAVKREFYDPEHFCNLGIVYLRNRRRGPAFKAFQRGLRLKPGHRRIRAELERHDRRSNPTFRFLPRNHPVNRMAGMWRSRLRDLLDRTRESEV